MPRVRLPRPPILVLALSEVEGIVGFMLRAYEFRLRPTRGQRRDLVALRRMARDLQNAAICERRDAWQTTDYAHVVVVGRDGQRRSHYKHVGRGERVSFKMQSAQLPQMRAEDPDGLGRWSATTQQQILRRVNKSYDAFFRRIREGDPKPGYPRFKPLSRVGSVDMRHGDGAKWDSTPKDRLRLYVQGVGHIKVHAHRSVPEDAEIKQLSVTFEDDRFYVRVVVETALARDIPRPSKEAVGIDMGTNPAFLTTSDNWTAPAPKFWRNAEKETKELQRKLTASKRGSNNRKRRAKKLRAAQAKIARQRRDYHHKIALTLVREYDTIVREDLQAANMSRTPKPKQDPETPGAFLPNGAAAKSGLNKSILDAGWASFFHILEAKAEEAGRLVLKVPPHHTSQMCEKCPNIDPASRSGRIFTCTRCGHSADADEQAARNILRLGMESLQEPAAA